MSLVTELKRRKVFRVVAVYVASAFAVLEGADLIIAGLGLPEGTFRWITVIAGSGLPIALGLSWFLEWGPDGIRTTAAAATPEGRSEMAAAEDHSVLDARTAVVAGVLVIFGLGLGAGWFLAPGGASEPDDGRPSIAVLPFENRSSDADASFFVDGIHDEVLTQVSKIAALRVISRSSVMRYREDPKPLRQVGRELAVNTVLVGGVQRAGDEVRISVQLVDTGSDAQLWAESYDQRLSPENLFAIQSDVARQIAMALDAELTVVESAELEDVPTTSQDAYDLYMIGNALYESSSSFEDLLHAADRYEEALALDPEFGLAWANLARSHSAVYHFHVDRTPERLQRARDAVDRALELDPDLPEAYRALGWHLYWGYRDYDAAMDALATAAAMRPNDPDVLSAQAAIAKRQGDVETAVLVSERAIRLNPVAGDIPGNLALLHVFARNYPEAERWNARALALNPNDVQGRILSASIPLFEDGNTDPLVAALEEMEGWDDAMGIIAIEHWRAAYHAGRYAEAIEAAGAGDLGVLAYQTYHYPRALLSGLARRASGDANGALADFETARSQLEQSLSEEPDEPRMLAAFGLTLAGLGEREAALAAGRRAVEVYPPSLDAMDGPEYVLQLARTHALLGDPDGAIDQLAIYLDGLGAWSLPGLLTYPEFARLPEHPRYGELVGRAAG